MSREEFFSALEAKVVRATEGWPDWKHEVLQNSFRSTNSNPRKVVTGKMESTSQVNLVTTREQKVEDSCN